MRELVAGRLYVFLEQSFGANQYILTYPETWVSIEASVPWSEVDHAQICRWENEGKIILTHGHLDHLGQLEQWRIRTTSSVWAHREEVPYFQNALLNGTAMYGRGETYALPDHLIEDESEIALAEQEYLLAWHLPGHTLGSCVFLWYRKEEEENVKRRPLGLFTGDVLIETSIGRTDFPGGNSLDMQNSLARLLPILQSLPKDLPVYCGHGDVLRVEDILRFNLWLQGRASF